MGEERFLVTEAVGKTLDLFRKLASEGRVNSEQLE